MGGKPKSKSSSASGSAQAWAQPYAKAGAGQVASVFNQNQPNLQNLSNVATNDLVPGMVGNFRSGIAGSQAAQGHYGNILSGKYIQGNPHLEAMIGAARGGITDQVNSQFSLAGRYGGGAHGAGLARELGNMETGLRYQNYSDEMARMDGAAGAAQQGNIAAGSQALAGLGVAGELPYIGANNYANSLGALFNGGTSQSKETGASPIWGAIGAGLGAAGMVAKCERSLKTNIEEAGEFNGLPLYRFEYRAGLGLPEGIFEGPMADEVAKIMPWMLGPRIDGHMTVHAGLVRKL